MPVKGLKTKPRIGFTLVWCDRAGFSSASVPYDRRKLEMAISIVNRVLANAKLWRSWRSEETPSIFLT
jgi:hypothetical protein